MRPVVAVLSVLFALGGAAAAEPPGDVVPYDRIVPGADASALAATLVVDAETGAAVPGATLRWYPERCTDGVASYDVLLAEGVADALGVAQVAWDATVGDGHWVASAPGYAPSHEYGVRPPPRMELRRGSPSFGRVVDLLGRPLAGVPVEAYLGCGHGPTVAATTTDARGRFVLPPLPGDATLWVVAPGAAVAKLTLDDPHGNLGARGIELVMRPAPTLRGTVTDVAGRPLAGVVVRTSEHSRGPQTTTGADGAFALHGVERLGGVRLVHPATQATLDLPDLDPSRAVRVRLSGVAPALPDAVATVVVRVRDEQGAPLPLHDVALVGEDGLVWTGQTREDDGDEPGTVEGDPPPRRGDAEVDVPAGAYEVRTETSFSSHEIGGRPVAVAAGARVVVEVRARRRPTLVVEGGPAEGVYAETGETTEVAEGVRVPFHARLLVRGPHGACGEVGPVGPDGVRRARLSRPARHRVRWPPTFPVDFAALAFRGDTVHAEHDGASLVTAAAGDLVLELGRRGDADLEVPVSLPAEDGAALEVTVDLAQARIPADPDGLRVRVRLADGSPPGDLELDATDGNASWKAWESAHETSDVGFLSRGTVRVSKRGYATLVARLDGPGTHELRFGRGALDLTVVGDDGEVVDADVLLDGEPYATTGGRLVLSGLAAGAHVAIVGDSRRPERVVVWRFSSGDGETVTRTVSVDAR